MSKPEFTAEEQYVISFVQQDKTGTWHPYVVSQFVLGVALAAMAVYVNSLYLAVCGICILVGYRIYEDRYQSRWTPVWRSIIEKYETALEDQA